MAADKGYLSWHAAVGHQFNEIYAITTEDAGFDEEYLHRHWKLHETPAEFVEWFGNKNDVDHRRSPIRAEDNVSGDATRAQRAAKLDRGRARSHSRRLFLDAPRRGRRQSLQQGRA